MPQLPDPPAGWPTPRRSVGRVLNAAFLGLISLLMAVVAVEATDAPSPWITVKALPVDGTGERRHTGRLHAFEGGLLPFLVARTAWLGANAAPAYPAIKFYFDHPEQRPRLREIDLPASR